MRREARCITRDQLSSEARQRYDEIKLLISAEADEDFIGLWEVVRSVRTEVPDADMRTVRQATIDIVEELLETGEWEAGSPTADGRGFTAWTVPAHVVVDRIQSEWDGFGREPNIGEIVWLNRN